MALLLGMTFALWVGASVVVVSLCVAAARGDRALVAVDAAGAPGAIEADLQRAQRNEHAA